MYKSLIALRPARHFYRRMNHFSSFFFISFFLFQILNGLRLIPLNENHFSNVRSLRKFESFQKSSKILTSLDSSNPFSSMFKSTPTPKKVTFPTVIVPPDYTLAVGASISTIVSAYEGKILPNAVIFGLLSALFIIQTFRVRFVFDNEAMEVFLSDPTTSKDGIKKSGENFAVGGENRWKYSTFTNWTFLPSRSVPILMYFKETQTKPEGQIHFFPVIMSPKILNDLMNERIPLPNK